jgi:hypothetical protein
MAHQNEELGTDHRHDMAITTGRPGIIDHDSADVGRLPRYCSTRSSNQLELVLTSKDLMWRGRAVHHEPHNSHSGH